jgi:hypothetical protein
VRWMGRESTLCHWSRISLIRGSGCQNLTSQFSGGKRPESCTHWSSVFVNRIEPLFRVTKHCKRESRMLYV